ncbi:vomeronasal type-2 receptor 26-like [Pseudophryne corroboree]|uniref:vomeronasal type-2 receptor 26-like n=1 Tax=Pseudophryne corroboree TaxID=495146 RepID=UPI00308179C8
MIISFQAKGGSISKTVQFVNCSHAAVVKVYRDWTNGTIVNNQWGSCGAPCATDVRGECWLQRWMKADLHDTVEQLTVKENLGVPDIYKYLKTVHFTNSAGIEVQFDESGDLHSDFDILNWIVHPNETLYSIKIGQYKPRSPHQLMLNETEIRWSPRFNQTPGSACSEICLSGTRKSPRESLSSCCYDCVPCPDGEISNHTDMDTCFKCSENEWPNELKNMCIPKIIVYLSYEEPLGKSLALVSVILFLFNCLVMIAFIKYKNTPVVKANNQDLSYILLVSLKLCFLSTLIFIGHPVQVTCLLRQMFFGIIFSIAISSILAKTITVIIAFNVTRPESKLNHLIGSKLPNYIVLLCTLFQIVICSVWLATFPPFPNYNMEDEVGKILAECNEGSIAGLYCVLGYMGFLAIVSFMIAFLARDLPDIFNEAKFITFSMLVFCSVWISFIPCYLSSKRKYAVAVEIFAIIASSSGLLGFIFIPKCYIILFKPELNNKANVLKSHMTNYV